MKVEEEDAIAKGLEIKAHASSNAQVSEEQRESRNSLKAYDY